MSKKLERRIEAGLVPGALVRNPGAPDWGIGQVQSCIGNRVTVNFQNVGKQLIHVDKVDLDVITSH